MYPSSWEADAILKDGHTVRIRPILPSDAAELTAFHERQSSESIYYRYLSPRPRLSETDLVHLTNVDYNARVAFVALVDNKIIGIGRYERYGGTDTAEVAFFIDDAEQGRGIGTILLEYLVAAAQDRGITKFVATTLPDNRRMLRVFAAAGFQASSRFEDGVIEVSFAILPTDESEAIVDRRRMHSQAASVRRLLEPKSVAVVGAGRHAGGIGAEVLLNLVKNQFNGEVYAVNRAGSTLVDVPTVTTVKELPDSVDLLVIATPPEEVPAILRAGAELGVGGVAIITTGFATNSEGDSTNVAGSTDHSGMHDPSDQPHSDQPHIVDLLEIARRHGFRMLGPNCFGIINTDEQIRLNATLTPIIPTRGKIAMLAESGTLASAILDRAHRWNLGMSTFVAAGMPVDVGAADLLSYWSEDDGTHGVLMYLAQQQLHQRFVRSARAASLIQPVVAVHTSPVRNIRSTHHAMRDPQTIVQAMFQQTGIIGVGSIRELFDVGRLIADQPLPTGQNLAIVGNSDGAIALAAQAARSFGLEVTEHHLGYLASAVEYREALTRIEALGLDDDARTGDAIPAHSVLVVHAPPLLTPDPDIEQTILDASRQSDRTYAVTMLGAAGRSQLGSNGDEHRVPIYMFPDDAVRAMGQLSNYHRWRSNALTTGSGSPQGCDYERAVEILENWPDDDHVVEQLLASEQLLSAYGVELIDRAVVVDQTMGEAQAEELGWPVVLKGQKRNRSSRSIRSGVVLDIGNSTEFNAAWQRLHSTFDDGFLPAIVQRFVDESIDIAVMFERHGDGTAVISVGLGGRSAAGGDAAYGVLPLTLADASALVAQSPVGRAMTDPLSRVRIVELVHRIAALVEDHEEISALIADPVIATSSTAEVADVYVHIERSNDGFAVRRLDS